MGEQTTFEDVLFGVTPRTARKLAGIFVRLSESSGRMHCRIYLGDATSHVEDMCEGRCDILIDDDGRLMLRSGPTYKVSDRAKSTGTSHISADRFCEELLNKLGAYGEHQYQVVWRTGQLLVIAPTRMEP